MSKRHSTTASFGYAMDGIVEALKNEPNIRIHLGFAILAVIFGFVFDINNTEWIILAFTIAFVLILEFINTSLEAITDLVSPKRRPRAKVAKDVAAAAVFVSALLSVVVGLFIFLPKILPLINK